MRVFTDDSGMEWTAWEVRPGQIVIGRAERRTGRDRRVAPAPDPVIERRRHPERRVHVRPLVSGVGTELAGGWVIFQSGAVRRRLAPVPDGWDLLSDAELVALCRDAVERSRDARA